MSKICPGAKLTCGKLPRNHTFELNVQKHVKRFIHAKINSIPDVVILTGARTKMTVFRKEKLPPSFGLKTLK